MPENLPKLSIVVSFCNEQGNVIPLMDEIHETLAHRFKLEIVAVDDGSSDDTVGELHRSRAMYPGVRMFCHVRDMGQSAALVTGVWAASADVIVTLDDRQQLCRWADNTPAVGALVLYHPAQAERVEAAAPSLKRVMSSRDDNVIVARIPPQTPLCCAESEGWRRGRLAICA